MEPRPIERPFNYFAELEQIKEANSRKANTWYKCPGCGSTDGDHPETCQWAYSPADRMEDDHSQKDTRFEKPFTPPDRIADDQEERVFFNNKWNRSSSKTDDKASNEVGSCIVCGETTGHKMGKDYLCPSNGGCGGKPVRSKQAGMYDAVNMFMDRKDYHKDDANQYHKMMGDSHLQSASKLQGATPWTGRTNPDGSPEFHAPGTFYGKPEHRDAYFAHMDAAQAHQEAIETTGTGMRYNKAKSKAWSASQAAWAKDPTKAPSVTSFKIAATKDTCMNCGKNKSTSKLRPALPGGGMVCKQTEKCNARAKQGWGSSR